jgi:hypothetical protein
MTIQWMDWKKYQYINLSTFQNIQKIHVDKFYYWTKILFFEFKLIFHYVFDVP